MQAKCYAGREIGSYSPAGAGSINVKLTFNFTAKLSRSRHSRHHRCTENLGKFRVETAQSWWDDFSSNRPGVFPPAMVRHDLLRRFAMKMTFSAAALFLVALTLPLIGGGCQSNKDTTAAQSSNGRMACSQCYDHFQKACSVGAPRGGLATDRAVSTHMCDGCKTEMSIYSEQNVLMAKCAKCAPDGVACDKWAAPTAYNAPNR